MNQTIFTGKLFDIPQNYIATFFVLSQMQFLIFPNTKPPPMFQNRGSFVPDLRLNEKNFTLYLQVLLDKIHLLKKS